ncbi:MAG TPA: hypothetical protein VG733_08455 [Chthoniobacteraceae bacterium]|nr:hypothetical protein [Chthoniobacteraceae bacterium]
MADNNENRGQSPNPATPGFKRFSGAKLVPLPSPIPQHVEKESFPVFLAVGIVLCIGVLIAVFVLSVTTVKRKSHASPSPTPLSAPASPAHRQS